MAGIPDPLDLIAIRDPQGTPWLALAGHPSWEQQIPPETEALGIPGAKHGCTSPPTSCPSPPCSDCGPGPRAKTGPDGGCPSRPTIPNVLLGAYPNDPQWSAADGSIPHWSAHRGGQMPEGLTHVAAMYAGTGSSRDASATPRPPAGRRQAPAGHTQLTHDADFTWNDGSGTGSVRPVRHIGRPRNPDNAPGPASQLTSAGLTLFWTVIVSNELHSTDYFSHLATSTGGQAPALPTSSTTTRSTCSPRLLAATLPVRRSSVRLLGT